ncbi:hypothetical protein DPEC_G00300850 [Dallia pectoralis]|uniref:Uncharacterized protein n=1 Tax=Dallia pectoralis TaxID=75939 RepID=A0ACC2FGK6_DALPE|nr:hypothetical protein DPEC_G00300850 [Dallia pectoralis]
MEGTKTRTNVPTYLVWSILNTLCCCLPLGIAAIVCSCKADNANEVGALERASEASRTAKILNIVGLVIGIVLFISVLAVKLTQK